MVKDILQISLKVTELVLSTVHYYFALTCPVRFCPEGCQTYKKTLAARAKENATPIKKQKLKRSLKQRVSSLSILLKMLKFLFINEGLHCNEGASSFRAKRRLDRELTHIVYACMQ